MDPMNTDAEDANEGAAAMSEDPSASAPANEQNQSQQSQASNSKSYKTTLCQFYLQGPCKNGDQCNYAHGTSELRTSTGLAVKDAVAEKPSTAKAKTKLCERFLQFGACQFGPNCTFAHGIKDLQKSIAELNPASNNPAYKTTLCKSYMEGLYCQFADKCQYAHGKSKGI